MIPNIITLIRLLGIIPLSISLFYYGIYSVWQLIVFVLIIITDFIDGYIARKYDMITDFGKMLDPIVDKILVIVTTIALLVRGVIPVYSLFIFARDIYVMVGAYYLMYKKKIIIPSDIWGKIKTVCHFVALAVILLLREWNIYSLVLLIIGFLTVIPESVFAYRMYVKKSHNNDGGILYGK